MLTNRAYCLARERKTVMSELVIKTTKENSDLPEDFDGHSVEKLHKIIDRKIKILEDSNKLQESCLVDIFNPLKMKEALDKASRSKK